MADPQKNSSDSPVKPTIIQPSITLNTEGPDENIPNESENKVKTDEELTESNGFKICTPELRASTIQLRKSTIIKPPHLNKNGTTAFTLKPSQLDRFSNSSKGSDKPNSEQTENSDSSINCETPKFVPLVVPEKTIPVANETQKKLNDSETIVSSSFVFGENLKERVADGTSISSDSSDASTSLGSNGTAQMLFSNVIKDTLKTKDGNLKDKDSKSLSESAREYEESRANKRKYEEVEVVTGEENETNILNVCCKLFSFNKQSSNWLELGRGTLRLNDLNDDDESGRIRSRLVFRSSGSLRVILNTKIWAEMVVEKASEKTVRITGLDANGEIKVFLIMSNIEDSNRLYSHLHARLEREISAKKRKKPESSSPTNDN
ncbi:unnamed protein product [Phyllotreta striolata]|uniref:RanBD1 domain-containing protein n=1 Tax=Phyllotreta striolata TaxID=444603 RepID=A0A9N9XPA6_PHYSR|nr:unnamed protein product [Phyllotreta striolata]